MTIYLFKNHTYALRVMSYPSLVLPPRLMEHQAARTTKQPKLHGIQLQRRSLVPGLWPLELLVRC